MNNFRKVLTALIPDQQLLFDFMSWGNIEINTRTVVTRLIKKHFPE